MSEILERLEWHQRNTATGTDSVFFAAAQEIERLTAALASAEAARDAARAVIRTAHTIMNTPLNTAKGVVSIRAQYKDEHQRAFSALDEYIDDIDYPETVPQPAAAPAVDAAPEWPDPTDGIEYDIAATDFEKMGDHAAKGEWQEAFEHLSFGLEQIIRAGRMQKGEPQS